MATVQIDYFGMSGQGKNVTEAKRDAGEKIQRALKGDYRPIVLTLGAETMIGWREPTLGWFYATSEQAIRDYRHNSGGQTREETENTMRHHLAQNAWNGTNDTECLEFIHDKRKQDDLRYWIKFQRDYQVLIAQGKSDIEAHRLAGSLS